MGKIKLAFKKCGLYLWNNKLRMIMSKAKVGVDRNVKIPKSILGKYNVKAGDVLTIQAMKGYIVLTPEKAKTSRNLQKKVNGHPKNIVQKNSEIDEERAEWMRFALQNFERAYGDNEPEYTSDMIIKPNPYYERLKA